MEEEMHFLEVTMLVATTRYCCCCSTIIPAASHVHGKDVVVE